MVNIIQDVNDNQGKNMQIPKKCPQCGKELEYLSEVHLIADTEPQETGIQGNCYRCGALVYSQFKMYKTEVTLFDVDGNEIGTKIII